MQIPENNSHNETEKSYGITAETERLFVRSKYSDFTRPLKM